MNTPLTPPAPNEYDPFFSDYVRRATARGDVTAALSLQLDEVRAALGSLTDTQALFRNAPGEWSIKQIVSHLIDTERVFSYRLLRISRKDKTPLPSFEQNDMVEESIADEIPFADLLAEFEFLRRANTLAIAHMTGDMLSQVGTASGAPMSARALIFMLVGHVDHHMDSMQQKYLPFLPK